MLNKQNIKDIYPLSPMQEGMLFHNLIDGDSTAYFEQSTYTINGKLDFTLFVQSINALIERHDILRTVFVHKNVSKPFQVVLKNVDFKITEKDLSHLSEKEQVVAFDKLKQADFDRPFKLDKDVLLRITLVQVGPQKHKVIWSHHHILMDGWCMGVLIVEFLHIYKSLLNGKTPSLNPPVPYVDYIKWLEKQDKNNSKSYWKNYLADVTERNSLPSFSKKEKSGYEKCILKFTLPQQLTEGIKALGVTHGITPNIVFQTTWGILLQRYNFSEQGVFGAVVSGRPPEIPGVSSIMGLFINTIPVKVNASSTEKFVDIAKQVQRDASDKLAHEHLSLADIAEQSPLKKDLIDHILVYENFPVSMDIENLDVKEYGFTINDIDTFEQTNYDLNVIFFPKGNDLHIKYDFNTLVYPEDVIKEVHQHYCHILEQVIQNKSLSEISLLDEAAKNEQLAQSVENPFDEPDVTVLNLFHEQVKAQPNAIAVNFEGKSLSYQELEVSSNRLAAVLINEYAINKGDIVALLADRSENLIVSILAILKAGAAYVPIDTGNPTDRIAYMLEDSGAKLLITDRNEEFSVPVFDISSIDRLSDHPLLTNRASLSDLAYIIYTSGSTGKPKGCKLTHANLLSYLNWANDYYFTNSAAEGHSCLFTSLSFDLTITSIFTPLIRGKQLTIYPQNWEIKELLKAVFSDDAPTDFVKITPAHATLLPHLGIDKTSVKAVLLGGEELKKEHVVNLKQLNSTITIFNEYGPTETTVGCSAKKITSAEEVITIGYPSSNATILIMDRHLNPLPSGAIGEICVLGSGVGLGYHNKPELTAEKFINYDGKKGYRTGDLGYKLPNGEIQCLGRMDGQVKLRGYRIETGEIEQQLLNTGKISQCFVKITAEMLCAYVVSDTPIKKSTMDELLGGFLPEYMLPDTYIQLEEIPLTINGKVDQQALPHPVSLNVTNYVAPETETEQKLAVIWQEVLGSKKDIGINENFFEIGGHSLKAMIATTKIHKSLDVQLPLKTFFSHPTIAQLSEVITQSTKNPYAAIEPVEERAWYPVSSAQKRMFVLHELEGEATSYNMPGALWVDGPLDLDRLEATFEGLIKKHESLRTSFFLKDGNPVQQIETSFSFNIERLTHPHGDTDQLIQQFIRPFDLSQAPLFRVGVCRVSDTRHLLLFDIHHIISDGTSMGLIIEDFIQLYDTQKTEPLAIQYKDFAVWQEQFFNSDYLNKQQKYWITQFENEDIITDLPTDFERPKIQQFDGASFNFKFDETLTTQLKKVCEEHDLTLFMLLNGIYSIFLAHQTGGEKFTVGTPVAGRPHADLQKIIGVFLNTLVIKSEPEHDKTISDFLKEVKHTALSAFENQDYPFHELVEALKLDRKLDRNPLFDTMFVVQNMNVGDLKTNELSFEQYEFNLGSAQVDISWIVFENDTTLDFTVNFNTTLFKEATVRSFVDRLSFVAHEVIAKINQPIKAVNLMPEKVQDAFLQDFNNYQLDYDANQEVFKRIKQQVVERGDSVAILDGENSFTFNEIWEHSNQLAYLVQEKSPEKGTIIPVVLERSINVVISILGILKSGNAYVFIDPNYPEERVKFMLEDSQSSLMITQKSLLNEIEFEGGQFIIDEAGLYENASKVDLPLDINANDLAYLIYTSGSTGKPKGVMLTHQNLNGFIAWAHEEFKDVPFEMVYNTTSYAFDLSIFEIFYTLSAGKKLRILQDGLEIADFLPKDNKVLLNTVPSVVKALLSQQADLSNVVAINMAGEPIARSIKEGLDLEKIEVRNLYGPSEDTTYSTVHKIKEATTPQNIGKPIANTQLYILDRSGKAVPPGVAGELCLSGDGITLGYHNRPELTSEKFIAHPFLANKKLYKTGDLAKWTVDGEVIYLGRIDHQVKIRGYRIELGEIEEQIRTIVGVQDVVVITRLINDELEICSYFVSEKGITSEDIQAQLKTTLPAFMIPSHMMAIEEIPLSPNGKLDRQALPEPERGTSQSGTIPQDETSQSLAKIWSEILGVDAVFLESDFFQLGGHSLRALLLVARIEKSFELKIPLIDIFKNRTLSAQVSLIKSSDKTKIFNIQKAPEQAHYPLSVAQKRLFFLEQMEGVGTSYHLPAVFEIKGNLDLIHLENSLNKLIQRHSILRTSFHLKEDEPIQLVHEKGVFNLEKIKQSNEIENAVSDFIRPFNLEQPTQLRIGIISESEAHHYLLFDMHHIISDGSSMGILVRELITLYHNESLPELSIQYYDFAYFQQSDNYKKGLAEQAEYWLSIFSDEVPLLELPTDFNRPAQQTFDGALHSFSLKQSTTEKLYQLAEKHDATLFMVMLGLYNVLLAKYSGQEDIVVGTPVAGRTHADLQQQIGMFVNTLPLRNKLNHAVSFTDFIAEVKTNALNAFDYQDYPFEKVIEQLNIPRRVNRNPLFDSMFVLQNTEKEAIEIEGLSFSPVDFDNKTSKFDLTLHASEIEDGIYLGLEYNTNLFKPDTITKMAAHFCQLVEAICAQPEKPLAEIDWIGSEERHRLIKTFNQSEITYPNLTALALFEEQVKANPKAIALETDELKLTFEELNNQANKLANYLLNKGLKKEEISAIFLDRNEKVIVSILGILKAGGAYLPIDKTLPENRVQYMLADSDAKFVLTDEQLNTSDLNCELIDISSTWETIEKSCTTDEPKILVVPEQLAYVIYTSGSTGQPKGCKIAHQNLFNYTRWAIDTYFADGNGSLGLYTSLSFDLTITSIFGSLCNGKPLFIYSETEVPDILTHTFSPSTTIDAVKITPAHISLLQHLPIQETNIEVAIVGGEAVTAKHISILKQLNPNIRIFNEYGPTETTVGCIVKELATDTEKVLIGKPIANIQVYILDEEQQLLPQGVFGEIWIGGAGVGLGYLNKPDLTATRFVSNPFGEGLIYKTGDVGRWTTTGEVDYLGRKDEQVKIKGYRIELGEIEAQLQQLPNVKEAVVIDVFDNTGEKQLVAYYTGSASTSEIKFALSEQLPSYMIPSFFVELDAIPLTTNGKVDRRSLPQPEKQSSAENFQAPESNIEQLLAEIWKQVLQVERVSISDDFFHLGGDSIKAIQVSSRLRNKGYSIKIKDIFENSRLKDLALKAEKTEFIANQNEVTGFAPLTAIQKAFLADENIDHNHYNQSVMLFNKDGFDEKIVAEAFKQLWKHHDALRMHIKDNQLLNLAVNDVEFKIANYAGLSVTEIEAKANEIQRSFDLQKAPLIRVALFPTNEGDHLLIIIHHLIVDGISWRILLEDFNTIYDHLKADKSVELPQKSTAFLTWASAVNNLANSDEFIRNQAYWFELARHEINPIFEAKNTENTIVSKKIAFDEVFTKKLLKQVNQTFGTDVNDILLSALSLTLADLSNEQDFLIALEGHGREDILPQLDVSRTVGWFTSMFPVLLNKSETDLARHIIETKENLRKIPQKGIGYGILKYLTDAAKKADFSEQIHPQVLFNFLGDFDESIASDNFTLSPLSNGDNASSKSNLYPLTLNGLIAHQKLQFDIDFNTSYLSEEQHEQFMKLFEQHLTAVVDCCLNQDVAIKTPSDYKLTDISYDELQKITESYNSEIEKIYPLSPMQQGMLFHNLMDGEDEAYFEQTVLSVNGNLNHELFEKAFNGIIARHEILRANMVYSQLKRPHQVILKEKFARIYHEDLASLNPQEQEKSIADYLEKEQKKGFDLSKDLLMKVAVFKVAEQNFKIVWTHHHIVIDGWCLGIIFNDFFSLYNSLSDGVNVELNPVQPYSNYIDWIESQDKHKAANYWSQLLEEVEEVVRIPGKIKDPKPGFEQANTEWELNETEFTELRRVANLHKVTPYTLLQTVWGILLQKYNSLDHVVFGSVVSGRPPEIDGVEQMVGLFINTVPVKVGRDNSFADTLKQVQQQSNLSGQFEYLPLGEITALSPLKNELINHLMIYENYPLEKQTEKLQNTANQIKIEGVENNERTNYDFTLTILPSETLTVSFDYNVHAYEKEWIERIKTHFSAMLNYVLHNPSQEIAAIPLLSAEEENELLDKTSAEKRENRAKHVPQLFAETVKQYSTNTALIQREKQINYAELEERSNQIAAYLIHEIGASANDVIGIFAKPSFDMMAALFGILKSGATYMPIDANYPPERIAYMLEDSKAKCVLYNTKLPQELESKVVQIEISQVIQEKDKSEEITVTIDSQDNAYIIYTSGSTGKPKGVVVTHENFVDYVLTMHEMFDISPQDMTLQHASIAFDTTIEELYPVLTAGGSLLLPNDNKDFEEIITNIVEYPVTIFCTSPLVLNYLNETMTDYGSLRLITVGGDELKSNYVDKIIDHVEIWNGYGPTESTVCATYYKITGNEHAMPIGRPFTNRSAYLMNQDGNLLPYGLAGELCVGGKGVASGYLNRPDLTAEKFVSNPFEKGKIYKTGDRCQWDENGNLLFYGRIDAQVKIRGFRIEIGEIEARLLKHSAVKEAVVLAWEDETNNGKFLAAYLTGNASEQELRTFLEQELPEYMVPAYFVFLGKMPLTINGKTDRKALQRPDTEKMAEENFAAAENETQEILTKVWSEILHINVGIDHNFFSLGGDSIKAIQMVSRIQKYHLRIEVRDLFANPTIRQLAPFVKSTTLQISQEPEIGEANLIPIQKAFLEERLVHPHHYNQSVILFSENRIDVNLLQNAIKGITTHHDALRMVLKENTLNYLSAENFGIPLEIISESKREKVESHIQQTQESFKLEKGPLFKAVLYQMEDGDHLFLVAHHLVVDGISWRIILEDLQQLLQGNNELPLKTHSFGEWGKQLKNYANGEQLKQELNYWQNVETISTNEPITENKYADNIRTSIELDEQQTENLLKHVNDAYNTEINDILLAALSASLESWDGNDQHVVFLEGHGREEIIEEIDINRTVGWFTAMYPIVLTTASEVTQLIKQTKEYLRKIPNKGIGYGVLRYLTPNTAFNLIPQITFNYLGQFDDTFSNENMKLSTLSSGYDVSLENSKESILDVSGMIVNSKLKMDFMYNPKISDEAVINGLKEEFKTNLLAIMNHCLEKEESEMTVSDFDSKDISEDELDDIMDMFDDL